METKKMTQRDGTIIFYVTIDGKSKFHNWDGAAVIPQGNKRLAEYYLFGIKHTKEQWEDKKQSCVGQPFYKTAVGKASGARV